MVAMTAALSAWAQAFFLDGHKAVHDKLNDTWLCSVPREVFGQQWTPVVTLDNSMTNAVIGGIEVQSGDQVTLDNIVGGKLFPFSAMVNGQRIAGNITFTWLPVLELVGEFGDEYAPGRVSLNAPDGSGKSDMTAKLKWRGGVTNTGNKHKRNYHIKFVDSIGDKKNRQLLDLRKDNHWKLDAGQIDPLRIRNRVCSDLWLDMSRDPWFKAIDSTAINGSRGRMTEVILNGKYHGIYGLIEPVDRKQLGLVKHDPAANVFHGQQWVSKLWAPTYFLPPYSNNSDTWNQNEVSYPEFEDVHPTNWSALYNSFSLIQRADAADNWQLLSDSLDYYFDMPVMEDYFILLVTIQALDNETKNIYYSLYDKATGDKRLTITPWDLDVSLGAKSLTGLTDAMVKPERGLDWILNLSLIDMFNHSEPHRQHIIDRYWQLRHTWLDTDNLVARFKTAVDDLENCGAAAREEARWSKDSDIDGKVLDISAEMLNVEQWIRRRMAYLDENIFVRQELIMGDVNGDGRVSIADVTDIVDHLLIGSPINERQADVNNDGRVSIADVTIIVDALFNI